MVAVSCPVLHGEVIMEQNIVSSLYVWCGGQRELEYNKYKQNPSELAPERTDAHSMLFTKGVGLSFFSFFLFFGSFSFGFTLFNIFQL